MHARSQSGQVAIEAALILPMMVFMVLGIIQLGMMYQARLMTEYAAYRAARAGIVNHGHCQLMQNAAVVAVLPTLGRPKVGASSGRVDTLVNALKVYKAYTMMPMRLVNLYHIPSRLEMVRVEVLSPRRSDIDSLFRRYGSHLDQLEIDYDDVRNDEVVRANLLTSRVTYFYDMRIPFANWLIHSWFMGFEYLRYMRGIQFENQNIAGVAASQVLEARGAMRGETARQKQDFKLIAGLTLSRKYVIPLVATWSMRMQSNLMKKHLQPCAVDQ